jgi:hypothetical protein
MRVVPEETGRMICRNFEHIVVRFAGLGQHIDRIVLRRMWWNRKTMKMEIPHAMHGEIAQLSLEWTSKSFT